MASASSAARLTRIVNIDRPRPKEMVRQVQFEAPQPIPFFPARNEFLHEKRPLSGSAAKFRDEPTSRREAGAFGSGRGAIRRPNAEGATR